MPIHPFPDVMDFGQQKNMLKLDKDNMNVNINEAAGPDNIPGQHLSSPGLCVQPPPAHTVHS